MSYSARLKSARGSSVSFGRGRLIRKERMRWFVQVLDKDGKIPFQIRRALYCQAVQPR